MIPFASTSLLTGSILSHLAENVVWIDDVFDVKEGIMTALRRFLGMLQSRRAEVYSVGILTVRSLYAPGNTTDVFVSRRVCGVACEAVARGLRAFLDRDLHNLGGNGRACADCHMPTDNFQLSPANVEARFQLLQFRRRFDRKADDPLFLPIDADDFRIHGERASDFSNLRRNALIRITFPLPPNIRLIRSRYQPADDRDVRRRVACRSNR